MSASRFSLSGLSFGGATKNAARDVVRLIDKLQIEPSDSLAVVAPEEVRIAALQVLFRQYQSLADYVADLNVYISDAVNRRCQMVCFPAFSGLLSLPLSPHFDPGALRPDPATDLPQRELFHACLSDCSDYAYEVYFAAMSAFAARYRIFILAGSTLYFEDDTLLHRAFLFNNKGALVGAQDKLSPTPLESGLAIEPAEELKAFDTPLGTVCILIGSDVFHFETALAAKGMGAHILLNPAAFPRQYTPVDTADGINLRVQEAGLYGVQSVLVGQAADYTLSGSACIFAPCEIAGPPGNNGVVALSNGRPAPDMAVGVLNLERLSTLADSYRSDSNPQFIGKYYDLLR
jgi:Predicted amidohydrolase